MGVVSSAPPGYLLAHAKTSNDTLCRRCGSWNVVCSLGRVRLELTVLSRLRLISIYSYCVPSSYSFSTSSCILLSCEPYQLRSQLALFIQPIESLKSTFMKIESRAVPDKPWQQL